MLRSKSMKIAAVLPHVEVFGGVRRYIEIGNELTRRGHHFVIYHPRGIKPDWIEFKGETRSFDDLQGRLSAHNEEQQIEQNKKDTKNSPTGKEREQKNEQSKIETSDSPKEKEGVMRREEEVFDAAICSEYSVMPFFDRLEARTKFFYFVLKGHKREKDVIKKDYVFLGCSEGICRRIEKKYGVACHRIVGGINPEIFYPIEKSRDVCDELETRHDKKTEPEKSQDKNSDLAKKPILGEFRILSYGRIYKRRKGIRYIIRAVEGLYKKHPNLKLIFFDSLVGGDRRDPRPLINTRVPHEFHLDLPQAKMGWLYSQADAFVSAEWRAGWSNTTAEAMACRVPAVCTKSGTQDFAAHNQTALVVPLPLPFLIRRQLRRLIQDENLRRRLAHAGYECVQHFTWSALVDRLEVILSETEPNTRDV